MDGVGNSGKKIDRDRWDNVNEGKASYEIRTEL